jgi:hypothetical protein
MAAFQKEARAAGAATAVAAQLTPNEAKIKPIDDRGLKGFA